MEDTRNVTTIAPHITLSRSRTKDIEREAIQCQIDRFLAHGGKIKLIQSNQLRTNPTSLMDDSLALPEGDSELYS